MNVNDQEIEVKFLLRDLAALAKRLDQLGARVTAPRVLETNLRFDTADVALTRTARVLRLRQDAGAVMTYKGPSERNSEVSAREEIEFSVSDFGAARRLLEALGYRVTIMYEKYRTTYALQNVLVVLDEMPIGNFAEIEGPDAAAIRGAANLLGLRWEARSTDSYLALFNTLRAKKQTRAKNLAFAELEDIEVAPQDLNLSYADAN